MIRRIYYGKINIDNGTTDIKQRVEYYTIGDKTYIIVAEEKENAQDTPLAIMGRLIKSCSERFIREQTTERTRCL